MPETVVFSEAVVPAEAVVLTGAVVLIVVVVVFVTFSGFGVLPEAVQPVRAKTQSAAVSADLIFVFYILVSP